MADTDISLERLEHGSACALEKAVAEWLRAQPSTAVPFLILPTRIEVGAWRRLLAERYPEATFGLTVTTLADHVGERLSLLGDGHPVVDGVSRSLRMARALQEARENGASTQLPVTRGVVDALSRAVYEGCCHEGFREAVRRCAQQGVSPAFEVLERYQARLDADGLVEYGDALHLLAEREFDDVRAICVSLDHPLPVEGLYLQKVGAQLHVLSPTGEGHDGPLSSLISHLYRKGTPLEPTSALRFASAAGVYAEPSLIADCVCGYRDAGVAPGRIFVTAPDPSALFGSVGPRLAAEGIASGGRHGETLSENLLGKAYLALRHVFVGTPPVDRFEAIAALTDYAVSPFSPIPPQRAYALDKNMRSDPSAGAEEYLEQLAGQDDAVRALFDLMRGGNHVAALGALYARGVGHLDPFRASLAKQACEDAGRLITAADAVGLEGPLLDELLAGIEVSVPYVMEALPASPKAASAPTASSSQGAVRFGTLADLVTADCDVALITQLSATGYPLASKGDPLPALFAQMGIERPDTTLEDTRALFKRALAAPSDAIVFERSLNDADAKPLRPSVLFEEVVDCFRSDITATDDLDEVHLLPIRLLEGEEAGVPICIGCGEENPVLLFPGPYGSRQADADTRPTHEVGAGGVSALSSSDVHRLVLADGEPVFSASEIETYLACPYSWFLAYKVRPEKPDALPDAKAYGSFAHGVLSDFYTRFSEPRPRHVDRTNLAEAHALFDVVFDGRCERDVDGIALATEMDLRTLDEWRRKLHALLDDDAVILPDYLPTRFEWAFGYEGSEVVSYAGHGFRGRVDRMDVDASGHAVIIDYKGSIDASYSPAVGPESTELSKVQGLIYAQVVRRELGLDPVAALYRSYKDCSTQGYYDIRVLPSGALSGMRDSSAIGHADGFDFKGLLELCEAQVAEGIDHLLAGDIPQSPATSAVCRYCPAVDCPNREAAS